MAAHLLALPKAQRRAELTDLVAREFRRGLLMSDDEQLPLDENYFALGLTSLKAAEVKQSLEDALGCELETPVLFSSSTVRQIADHLAAIVLPATAPGPPPVPAEPVAERRRLVDDLLRDLYED
jgi:acyl carrier protein